MQEWPRWVSLIFVLLGYFFALSGAAQLSVEAVEKPLVLNIIYQRRYKRLKYIFKWFC